nr:hypothetical protein HmN_000913000 [Hymenolepis microstoma]
MRTVELESSNSRQFHCMVSFTFHGKLLLILNNSHIRQILQSTGKLNHIKVQFALSPFSVLKFIAFRIVTYHSASFQSSPRN